MSRKLNAPRWLRTPSELNEYGKRFWKAHAARLHRAERLKEDDVPLFLLLAQAYGMALESQQKILDEGLFRQDENSVTRRHPAVQVHRDAVAMYGKIAERFGLSPLVRFQKKILDDTVDEFEAFLRRRHNKT